MQLNRIKRVLLHISLPWLVAGFSVFLLLFALPLLDLSQSFLPERVIGINGPFLAALVVSPCLIGFALYWFCKKADDLERHMRKFENE